MAKVLLINPIIRDFAPPNNPPLGLMYLVSVLRAAGHEAEICDLNAGRWMVDDREYWLKKYKGKWDYIGIGGLIVTYNQQRWILDYLNDNRKAFGDPVILGGGSLVSSAPEFAASYLSEIDIMVIGEGEQTILDIVGGRMLREEIPGIAYVDKAFTVHGCLFIQKTTSRPMIEDLDTVPFPAWDAVPMEEVYLGNAIWGAKAGNSSQIKYDAKRSTNMINSRGCPHRCSFCFHYIWGNKYRMRSVDNVMAELHTLKAMYDIDFVGFVDDNTTAKRSWMIEFCDAMIATGLSKAIRWGCSATVTALDPDECFKMAEAGCRWVGFGIESAALEIREAMHKNGTMDQAADSVKAVRSAGMWANTSYVLGHPGETIETARLTAQWMRDHDCLNSVFFATPYPGTELWDLALPKIRAAYDSEANYIMTLADATDFTINLTDIPDDDLVAIRTKMMEGEVF